MELKRSTPDARLLAGARDTTNRGGFARRRPHHPRRRRHARARSAAATAPTPSRARRPGDPSPAPAVREAVAVDGVVTRRDARSFVEAIVAERERQADRSEAWAWCAWGRRTAER
jgi:hypothetical protein